MNVLCYFNVFVGYLVSKIVFMQSITIHIGIGFLIHKFRIIKFRSTFRSWFTYLCFLPRIQSFHPIECLCFSKFLSSYQLDQTVALYLVGLEVKLPNPNSNFNHKYSSYFQSWPHIFHHIKLLFYLYSI